MSEAFLSIWAVLLLSMVGIWFVLILWLFRRLRERHFPTYEAMGSPSLFWNNSLANNWSFLKFLFRSEWRALGDPALARVCSFMRLFMIIYLLLFFGPVFMVYTGAFPAQ